MKNTKEFLASRYFSQLNKNDESKKSDHSPLSEEIISDYLYSKFMDQAGTKSLRAKLFKIITIPIAAIPFSNIVKPSDDASEYFSNKNLINNFAFTASTYVSHYFYTYGSQIEENCKKISNLYDQSLMFTEMLDQYNADEEKKCNLGRIITRSFLNALNAREISSINQLNDFRVIECALNMTVALNTFLIGIKSEQKVNPNASFSIFEPNKIERISLGISNRFGDIIASTFQKRHFVSNLTSGYYPTHIRMLPTPSIQNFTDIIKHVFEKAEKGISPSASTLSSFYPLNSTTSLESIKVSVDDIKTSPEDEIISEKARTSKSKRYYKAYGQFLKHNMTNESLTGIASLLDYVSERLGENNIFTKVYKFFTCAAAGTAFYNPIADDTSMRWEFKYLISTAILAAASLFYHLYDNLKSRIWVRNEAYDRLEELIKSLISRKLISEVQDKGYVCNAKVERIHEVISSTFTEICNTKQIKVSDLANETKSFIFARTYSALSLVLIEELDKNSLFEIPKESVFPIAHAFAEEINPKLSNSFLIKNSKFELKSSLFEERLRDIVKSKLNILSHDNQIASGSIEKWRAFVHKRANENQQNVVLGMAN